MTVQATNANGSKPMPSFTGWLVKEACSFIDGRNVECWNLNWQSDSAILDDWAVHLRQQYISDNKLAARCVFRKLQPAAYLTSWVVPSDKRIRTGDFAEILIADVFEYLYGFGVPRYKQCDRPDKDSSEHGTDVIAYKIKKSGKKSYDDELIAIEVKSDASGTTQSSLIRRIIAADTDSFKDPNRIPMTLSYMVDRAYDAEDMQTARDLLRFLDKAGSTFQKRYASAVTTSFADPKGALSTRYPDDVKLEDKRSLVIVHADRFMELVNDLYGRMTK